MLRLARMAGIHAATPRPLTSLKESCGPIARAEAMLRVRSSQSDRATTLRGFRPFRMAQGTSVAAALCDFVRPFSLGPARMAEIHRRSGIEDPSKVRNRGRSGKLCSEEAGHVWACFVHPATGETTRIVLRPGRVSSAPSRSQAGDTDVRRRSRRSATERLAPAASHSGQGSWPPLALRTPARDRGPRCDRPAQGSLSPGRRRRVRRALAPPRSFGNSARRLASRSRSPDSPSFSRISTFTTARRDLAPREDHEPSREYQ